MSDLGEPLPPESIEPPSDQPGATQPRKRSKRAARSESRVPRWRLALGGIAALFLLAAPFWAPLVLRRMDFFRLRRVEIVGARYVAPSDILARLHVDTMASVWDPTGVLARRVAAHAEVRTVAIRRRLPGTIIVEITERVPVALVPSAQGFRPYDERGVALPIDPSRTVIDAPILARRDTGLLHLLAALRNDNPALYQRVSEVRQVGLDELLIELAPFVPVRAMKDVTVQRLADIEPVESDLARRQLRPAELDLRYRDQVIARLQ